MGIDVTPEPPLIPERMPHELPDCKWPQTIERLLPALNCSR